MITPMKNYNFKQCANNIENYITSDCVYEINA